MICRPNTKVSNVIRHYRLEKTLLAIQLLLPFSYYAFYFCSFSSFMKLIVEGQHLMDLYQIDVAHPYE